MTAAELIELLSKYPADMRVIVNGYEGGYDDITAPVKTPIKLNFYKQWYYGPHTDGGTEHDEIALLVGPAS